MKILDEQCEIFKTELEDHINDYETRLKEYSNEVENGHNIFYGIGKGSACFFEDIRKFFGGRYHYFNYNNSCLQELS